MSGLSVFDRADSVNGTAKRPARKPAVPAKKRSAGKAMKRARRLAYGVGAVGVPDPVAPHRLVAAVPHVDDVLVEVAGGGE